MVGILPPLPISLRRVNFRRKKLSMTTASDIIIHEPMISQSAVINVRISLKGRKMSARQRFKKFIKDDI